jgi:hypothetical protein
MWRMLMQVETTLHYSDRKNLEKVFDEGIGSFVSNGEFKRRFVAMLVTDLAMLICFGVLFPPLALVIALSVVKDVLSMKISLGRYQTIMETLKNGNQVDDSCDSENGVERFGLKDRMIKLRDDMNEEILKAGVEIWNGVWNGFIMASWIWAFVLFDTLSSAIGVSSGLSVLLGMLVSPHLLQRIIPMWPKLSVVKYFESQQMENIIKRISSRPWTGMTNRPVSYRTDEVFNAMTSNEVQIEMSVTNHEVAETSMEVVSLQ